MTGHRLCRTTGDGHSHSALLQCKQAGVKQRRADDEGTQSMQ